MIVILNLVMELIWSYPFSVYFAQLVINSKITREINKAEKEIKKEKSLNTKKFNNTSTSSIIDLTKKLQFRISIKNGKEILPFILVNFSLDNMEYNDFLMKVEQVISKHIGLIFKNEYLLAYKDVLESEVKTLLDNENTFEEFLKDCQHY